MKREAKANLARIVVYALEKENGKKKENGCCNTHLFDCLGAGNFTLHGREAKS